ncbi:unnamed protein product [Ilex paraguariensis]|uniref:Acid phosphatase/vanadium-dependent haloperoxidase-related protein n=1 Tax=Ilex paraguariensis TaxID=185542 RepID=A0ABC8T7W3_9AQUA
MDRDVERDCGWFKEKRWDSRRILSSGGMPSSHSATVTALAAAIGLQEGTGGSGFAIAVVLACVVCTLSTRSSSFFCSAVLAYAFLKNQSMDTTVLRASGLCTGGRLAL